MGSNRLIWLGMVVGSFLGGLVPYLWGSGFTSFSSVITTAIGGILGIWIGYKLG